VTPDLVVGSIADREMLNAHIDIDLPVHTNVRTPPSASPFLGRHGSRGPCCTARDAVSPAQNFALCDSACIDRNRHLGNLASHHVNARSQASALSSRATGAEAVLRAGTP